MAEHGGSGAGGAADSVAPLPGVPVLLQRSFTAVTVTDLRHAVAAAVDRAGMCGDTAADFVLAVHELVTNAVRHGGGAGDLQLRLLDDVLVCDVVDHGAGAESLPVQLSADTVPGGRGLWLAHHLTGSLLLTSRPGGGVTASVSACLTGPPAASPPAAPPAAAPFDGDPAFPSPEGPCL